MTVQASGWTPGASWLPPGSVWSPVPARPRVRGSRSFGEHWLAPGMLTPLQAGRGSGEGTGQHLRGLPGSRSAACRAQRAICSREGPYSKSSGRGGCITSLP